MKKLNKLLKNIFTGDIAPVTYAYLAMKSLVVGGLMWTGLFSPDTYKDYKCADSISEYFTHLATDTASMKEFHRTIPLQMALNETGYDCGPVDGLYGKQVKKAVADFQKDHGLPVDSLANTEMFNRLTETVLADSLVELRLENKLLEPFRDADRRAFIKNLDQEVNSIKAALKAALMPHVEFLAWYHTITHDHYPTAIDDLEIGNNLQVADAYRHAETTYRLSRSVGGDVALGMGNFRELSNKDNPLPSMLMDLYNHHAAVEAWRDRKKHKDMTVKEILTKKIENGDMITQPFPLVPRP